MTRRRSGLSSREIHAETLGPRSRRAAWYIAMIGLSCFLGVSGRLAASILAFVAPAVLLSEFWLVRWSIGNAAIPSWSFRSDRGVYRKAIMRLIPALPDGAEALPPRSVSASLRRRICRLCGLLIPPYVALFGLFWGTSAIDFAPITVGTKPVFARGEPHYLGDGGSTVYPGWGYTLIALRRLDGTAGPRIEFTCGRYWPILRHLLWDYELTRRAQGQPRQWRVVQEQRYSRWWIKPLRALLKAIELSVAGVVVGLVLSSRRVQSGCRFAAALWKQWLLSCAVWAITFAWGHRVGVFRGDRWRDVVAAYVALSMLSVALWQHSGTAGPRGSPERGIPGPA